jgi:hypothetical protein
VPVAIHATLTGDGKVIAKVEGWKLALINFAPVWDDFAHDLAAFHGAQFASEGAFGGEKWAPLNPKYKAEKIARGGNPHILIDTGRMLQEATNPSKILRTSQRHRGVFAIPTRYYVFHHTGAPRNHMPARRVTKVHPLLTAALRRRIKDRLN